MAQRKPTKRATPRQQPAALDKGAARGTRLGTASKSSAGLSGRTAAGGRTSAGGRTAGGRTSAGGRTAAAPKVSPKVTPKATSKVSSKLTAKASAQVKSKGGSAPFVRNTSRVAAGSTSATRTPRTGARTAAGAATSSSRAARRPEPGERTGANLVVRRVMIGGIVVAASLLVALLGYVILSFTPVFTIQNVQAQATEHLSQEAIGKLADIPAGTTLLNLDEAAITQNLKKNPWVASVDFQKNFPNNLTLVVHERAVGALVTMGSSNVCWYLSDGYVWIEPVTLTVADGQSIKQVALAKARELGVLLISDLPASVTPQAGSAATDDVLMAVQSYQEQFSESFRSQIVSYSAASVESITATLASGVELSLGAPNSVVSKESIITQLIQENEGKITYINVRVPANPSYRKVNSDSVGAGSGVTAGSTASATTDSANDPAASNNASAQESSTALAEPAQSAAPTS